MTGTSARPDCPDWCTEEDEHTTHRRLLTNIIHVGGVRHEGIRLGLILPPRRRHTRAEMMIYRGKTEVMRFEAGWLGVTYLAEKLTEAAQHIRTIHPCGCEICQRSTPS